MEECGVRSVVRLAATLVAAVTAALGLPGIGAAGATPLIARYVALGDSYASGPMIPNQLADPPGCQRSDHDYPHLLAASLGTVLRDVSCSGAATVDLASPQAVSGGPNPPQLDAVDATADLVTLQIGGNDIGFAEIVKTCVSALPIGSPCRDHYRAGGPDQISARILATAPKITAALAAIRARAPHAQILLVGYPQILPEATAGCWPIMPFAWADVGWLRNREKELNAMLAERAAAAGATYVDTYGPSAGRDACQVPGVRWIEPVVPIAPAAPVHPNADGMTAFARIVRAALLA